MTSIGQLEMESSLEGYVVTPPIQQRRSDLPPVLTLLAIALAGALSGFVGLLVAAPLAVALRTAVEHLSIEDVLGDRPGHERRADAWPRFLTRRSRPISCIVPT